jgi:hypothetical protein
MTHMAEISADPRDEFISEAKVMSGLIEVLTLYGYRSYRVGQMDARRTQDPGVSDIIAFHPLDGVLFVEAKRPRRNKDRKDRQSPAQKTFESDAVRAGARYFLTHDQQLLHEELARIRTLRPRTLPG